MANTYDFYKPRLELEYPEVDGPLSVTTYITALDQSYSRYREKSAKAAGKTPEDAHIISAESFDYSLFHSPYGKLVQKGHARVLYNDFVSDSKRPVFANLANASDLLAVPYKSSIADKGIEKAFVGLAKDIYKKSVEPGMRCAKRLGNMYTGSLYGGLASLVSTVSSDQLQGKRISMFAYGSGCAASWYSIRVKGSTAEIASKMDLLNRLESMKVVPCQDYVEALKVRFSPFLDLEFVPRLFL
jgi:hydroxymethylglutaryl-CoA synthase